MRTVIIVDDEPITRMDLAEMLAELDFTVLGEAGDGFDAIELCRARRPDVVLMDVKMPVFDGLTAAETIVADDLAECVVLLTAFGQRDIVERANRIGVTRLPGQGPSSSGCLLPTIEVALAQSRRLRQSRRGGGAGPPAGGGEQGHRQGPGPAGQGDGRLRDAGLPGAAADRPWTSAPPIAALAAAFVEQRTPAAGGGPGKRACCRGGGG